MLHYWKINSSVSAKSKDVSQVQIFSNVSNTTGTLTNLRLSEAYAVTVQMCTHVGCGPTSQPIYIPEETAAGSFTLTKGSVGFHVSQKIESSVFFQCQGNVRKFEHVKESVNSTCKSVRKVREFYTWLVTRFGED